MTAAQEERILKLVKIPRPSKEVQRLILNYWMKSFMTMNQFSKQFGLKHDRLGKMRLSNIKYVEKKLRKMLYDSVVNLYTANANRVKKLIDISNDRVVAKQKLMNVIKMKSIELNDEYKKTKDKTKKDDIVLKAMQLLNLLDGLKDEEVIHMKKIIEMMNINSENVEKPEPTDDEIKVDKEIIKYIEDKNENK